MFRQALLAGVCGAALITPAFAQEQGADSQEGASQIETIVVTAQRREQSQQDVPVSITALSAESIARAGIQTTQDIQMATPGLTMTTTRNGMTPYLRGVGTSSGFIEGSVAFYVDNVYFSSTAGSLMGLNNVERVEVLKGPQGTLFGRNATGGLVHVITKDPSHTTSVNGSIGYANYDTVSGSIYATTGLTDDIAMDFAAYGSRQGNGWGKNVALGNDVNMRREWSVRSKIKYEPSSDTSLVLAGDYGWWKSDIGSVRQVIPGAIAQGGVSHVGSIYDINSNMTSDPGPEFGNGAASYQYGFSGVFKQRLSDDISLVSTTAYRRYMVRSYLDNDLTPLQASDVFFQEPSRSFQQEVLINGSSSRLDWTVGGIYYSSRGGYDPLEIHSTFGPTLMLNFEAHAPVFSKSFAVFGQGSYKLTDATTLTLGARYTFDRTHIVAVRYATEGNPSYDVGEVIPAAGTDGQPYSRTHAKWNRPTWRIALDHKLSRDVLVYASYNRGYKAGAFNPSVPPNALNVSPFGDAVNPEKLDAYEVGLKSELFDRQLRFNVSAFRYDYKNIQLTQLAPDGASLNLFNAGAARTNGIEVESIFAPRIDTGHLELRFSGSYLDAKYTDAVGVPFTDPVLTPPYGNVSYNDDATGNRVIKTPKFAYTVAADYRLPVSDDYEVGVNINWVHTGKFYWEVDNRLFQEATDLVNAQLSFGRQDDAWGVRLWARNLTDVEYFSTQQSANNGDSGGPAAPRTYGVTLDFKFGG